MLDMIITRMGGFKVNLELPPKRYDVRGRSGKE
jgi:hypothetical protein